MNNFYNHSDGVPAAQTRGTTALIRNEFDLIQAGFDLIGQNFAGFAGAVIVAGTDGGAVNAYTLTPATALTAYSSKMLVVIAPTTTNTGATTLNISGLGVKALNSVSGTPLVAGDLAAGSYYLAIYNGTEFRLTAVTKNYADQLAFSAVLPNQAGSDGKFLHTVGGAASWAYAGISTINATVTTSATLAGSYLYVPVAMTALGQSVTLPSALTLSVGGPQYVIDNTKGAYPAGIRDNTGTLLMAVAPGGEALVSLKDNTTQAGVWSVTGSNLEPGLITIDSTFSSTYASTVLAPFVALDSNTSIHFAALASGFAAFVVDNTGKVLSTPVTVDAGASMAPVQAFKVSATSAIVFYSDSGNTGANKAVVLTISGSSPSLTLTVGTAASLASGSNFTSWGSENFTAAPKIAQLSSTSYVATSAWAGGAVITGVVAISVSGTTVTIGAVTTIISSNTVAGSTTTYALTTTTALVLYLSGAGAPYTVNAVVVSVSGTTCTVGTPAAGGTMSTAGGPPSSVLLSATKALVATDSNNTLAGVNAFTISGTTISSGAVATVEATSLGIGSMIYVANSATRYNPHLWPIGSNTAGLWYLDSGGISRAVVLTESSGTVTAGTILYDSISSSSVNNVGYGAILPQGATEFISLKMQVANTAGFGLYIEPHKISGTSITYGASRSIRELNPTGGPANINASRLSSGDYVITGYQDNCMVPVLRSNGDSMNYRGTVSVPPLQTPANTPQVIATTSNRIVLLGSTQQGTTGGATAYKLRLLNIEVAA